jgi:predicted DsbA family dithiol-disulfide isomerase
MSHRWIAALILGISLTTVAYGAGDNPKADDAVAKINGRIVTRSELFDKGGSTLLQQRYDNYRIEREELGRVIDGELLELEAHHRGITLAQLIEQEINSKVKDPTEEELRVFYEGAQTDQTYDSVRAQLIARVRQTRTRKLREIFLDSLRRQAKIQILLLPPFVQVALEDAPARGPKNAPVAFVEFADFECPFCRQMQPEIEKLLKEYNGKVALYFKDFPLPIHPHAEKAAEAARCAAEQGAFWDYHDVLFREGSSLEVSQLKEFARALGQDTARFNACLDGGGKIPVIEKDLAQGRRLGIAGTPGFFINGHFLSGVVSYETLREVVEQQLNQGR